MVFVFGTPEMKHPGCQTCMTRPNTSWKAAVISVPTLALKRRGESACKTHPIRVGADITTGYPDHLLVKKLGWWDELTRC
jgi:formate dehydrogenase major subunit